MTDFFGDLARELKKAAKSPNVLSWKPNSPTHEAFHRSVKTGRLLRGGNRAGKSVSGAVEGIWRATGKHPFIPTHDVPIRGRIVTVDIDNGLELIIKPLLKQWTPPSELVNGSWEDSFSSRKKTMTFRNGSVIDIKTHQQEIDAYAGVPLHWVWFDEECPKAIFDECRLRLIDFNGVWWMTMTPVEGQDWIFDRFITEDSKNVEKFEISIHDNPHLNKEALRILSEDLTDEEKEVREKGVFIPRGGLILKKFDYNRHVIEGGNPVPKDWPVYVSIDHGFNNPTAILWHAVSPQGEVVTFAEHYRSKMVIEQHVVKIKEMNKRWNVKPVTYIGDPSMSQKSGITGTSPLMTYREHGIPLIQAKRDVDGGINKMNEYFENDLWHITKDCPNTIKEFRGYAFKIFTSPKIADRNNVREEPNKKNDHTPDSARYFFTIMPHISASLRKVREARPKLSLTETNREDFPWEVDSQFYGGGSDELAFGEIY